MRQFKSLAMVVAVLLCVSLVVGCGASTTQKYEEWLNATTEEMTTLQQKGSNVITSGDVTAATDYIDEALTSFDKWIGEANAIKVPSNMQSEHDTLVEALTTQRDAIAEMRDLVVPPAQ